MNEVRRVAADLIEKLDREAQKFTVVVMVVVFKYEKTIFIRSDSRTRLSTLTAALAREGELVGIHRFERRPNGDLILWPHVARTRRRKVFGWHR